jgi:predicted enzyme related to lactoylglutathione lyase
MEVTLSWYPAQDLEKAKKFYGEVLGLKKTFEIQGWAEFSHAEGAASIGLSANPAYAERQGATVVLKVDDLEQARKELSQRGVKFEGEVEEVPGIVRIATFRDPLGNRLQLAQVLFQKQ